MWAMLVSPCFVLKGLCAMSKLLDDLKASNEKQQRLNECAIGVRTYLDEATASLDGTMNADDEVAILSLAVPCEILLKAAKLSMPNAMAKKPRVKKGEGETKPRKPRAK